MDRIESLDIVIPDYQAHAPRGQPAQVSPVALLREIARRCELGEPLAAEQSAWLGEILTTFLDSETTSLEEILGLSYGRGGLPWRQAEAKRERDDALRALAEEFFGAERPCARSAKIATLARRYGASAWRIDRDSQTMPEHYSGTPREHLWRAYRSGATMPLGERQIRNIVCG